MFNHKHAPGIFRFVIVNRNRNRQISAAVKTDLLRRIIDNQPLPERNKGNLLYVFGKIMVWRFQINQQIAVGYFITGLPGCFYRKTVARFQNFILPNLRNLGNLFNNRQTERYFDRLRHTFFLARQPGNGCLKIFRTVFFYRIPFGFQTKLPISRLVIAILNQPVNNKFLRQALLPGFNFITFGKRPFNAGRQPGITGIRPVSVPAVMHLQPQQQIDSGLRIKLIG